MKKNDTPFLKNADIRAGRIPGWSNRPETNGDPYDKNNTERTDASMVVSEGMIAQNAVSLHAAKYFGLRKIFLYVMCAPFIVVAGSYAYGKATGSTPVFFQSAEKTAEEPVYEEAGEQTEAAQASQFIDHVYSKMTGGVAGRYDTSFFSQFGWPSKKYDYVFGNSVYSYLSQKYASGQLKDTSARVTELCANKALADCLPELSSDDAFVALADAGENMQMYTMSGDKSNDTNSPNEKLEAILADAAKQFEENKAVIKNYCGSTNRRFASTWGVQQAEANINIISRKWQEEGKLVDFTKNIAKVGSMKELIEMRKDNKDCNNLNVAILPVSSGSVKYIMNVSARVHTRDGDNVGTGLYLLGELSDKNVVALVATNNSNNISIFDESSAQSNAREILPNLNKSASEIVDLFEDSDYSIEDKNNTTEKSE